MTIRPSNKVRLLPCVAFVCLLHSTVSVGQEVVAGWEGASSRGYAFVSPAITFQRGESISWVLRAAASYLYYDFPEGGGKTDVRSPGESLGVALRYSAPGISATIGPGYEVRQTRRRFASGAETKTNEHGVIVQGDIFVQATPRTILSAIVSYGDANRYYWARGGVKQQITNFDNQNATTLHVGAEITGQGNNDSKSAQLGGLFEIAFPRSQGSLQFRSGYSRIENSDGSRESRPYFGVGLYRAF
jgi:hypothetical protein